MSLLHATALQARPATQHPTCLSPEASLKPLDLVVERAGCVGDCIPLKLFPVRGTLFGHFCMRTF